MPKQTKHQLVPETVTESKESFGYHWELKSKMHTRPTIEIWWERQRLIIRQQNGENVDMVNLEVGMAYDLMKVISRALDVGPE